MNEDLKALHAAIEGLAIHGEACGHKSRNAGCGYCDDKRVATTARKALKKLAAQLATHPASTGLTNEGSK